MKIIGKVWGAFSIKVIAGFLLLLFLTLSTPAMAAGEMTATRSISDQTVNSGDTFTVTVSLTANQDLVAPALDEDLPTGWNVTPVSSDGAIFKESTTEWVWTSSMSTGEGKTVVYDVEVPSDATSGTYQIGGSVSAFQVSAITVGGDNDVTVGSTSSSITATRSISDQTVNIGETFTVTVNLTANQKLVAPALDEDLPTGWNVTPVSSDGAIFKESTTEWVWTSSMSAGESKTIVYDVDVPSDASPGTYSISGNVSAYQVSAIVVGGDDEVTVSDKEPPVSDGIQLYSGWNFISVPYELKSSSVESVLADVNYDDLTYFDCKLGMWVPVTAFEPLKGYWIFVSEDSIIPKEAIEPQLPTTPQTVELYPGWNCIGYTDSRYSLSAELTLAYIDDSYLVIQGPWDPVSESCEYVGHNNEVGTISGNHVGTDVFEMETYEGYWVFVTDECTLNSIGF